MFFTAKLDEYSYGTSIKNSQPRLLSLSAAAEGRLIDMQESDCPVFCSLESAGVSYSYELIGAQFQALAMLLRDDIRHNQRSSGSNQAQSRWLRLAQGELRSAQPQLTLHPCVTQGQIRKELCVRVDFTLLLSAILESNLLSQCAQLG